MSELTGKTRFRHERKWGRSRLILQVEETSWQDTNCGRYIDSERIVRWRDAQVEDMWNLPNCLEPTRMVAA